MNINNLLRLLLFSFCSVTLPMELELGVLASLMQEFTQESPEIEEASELLLELFNAGNKQRTYKIDNNEAVKLWPQKKVGRKPGAICPYCNSRIKCVELHIRRHHGSGSKKVNCATCDQLLAARNLSGHMRRIHNQRLNKKNNLYECCDEFFLPYKWSAS
jgi:hypothetical protein